MLQADCPFFPQNRYIPLSFNDIPKSLIIRVFSGEMSFAAKYAILASIPTANFNISGAVFTNVKTLGANVDDHFIGINKCIIGKCVSLSTTRSIVFKILLNVSSVHESIQIFAINNSRIGSNKRTMIAKEDIFEIICNIVIIDINKVAKTYRRSTLYRFLVDTANLNFSDVGKLVFLQFHSFTNKLLVAVIFKFFL